MLSLPDSSRAGYVSLGTATRSLTNEPPQLRGRLEKCSVLGRVNLGSPVVRIVALVAIGLGTAAICTGFVAPAGAFLLGGGLFLLGGSVETSIRDTAAERMSPLNIVSYNTGTNRADYGLICSYNGSEPTEENYQTSQARTAAFFRDLAQRNQVDALLLQEIGGAGPLLEALRQEGFVIYQKGQLNRFNEPIDDCAIALNPKRFQVLLVAYKDIDGDHVPIVLARDKKTGHALMFASAHVPGMNLVDLSKASEQAEMGDGYLRKLVGAMDTEIPTGGSVVIQVLGADMNRNPERWNRPFQKLTEEGFDIHRTRQTTEVNPTQQSYVERELDFVVTGVIPPSRSRFERTLGIPPKVPRVVANKVSTLMDFGVTDGVSDNASDHRPVHAKLSFF